MKRIDKILRYNLSQIIAITEKNIKLATRFKFKFIISLITPIILIITPVFILGKFFEFSQNFGPWNARNYLLFIFIAYNIYLLFNVITEIQTQFYIEKYWETLPALIIAPFNKFNLLFGIILAHLTLISIPFILFLVICIVIYPVSLLTLFSILFTYLLITFIFSGIGFIVGIFTISNENMSTLLLFAIKIILWFSCVTYPYQIFPDFVQTIILINPLYYVFDFLRLVWIENNIFASISIHWIHFSIIAFLSLLLPIIGMYIFNLIYKQYGIVGY